MDLSTSFDVWLTLTRSGEPRAGAEDTWTGSTCERKIEEVSRTNSLFELLSAATISDDQICVGRVWAINMRESFGHVSGSN